MNKYHLFIICIYTLLISSSMIQSDSPQIPTGSYRLETQMTVLRLYQTTNSIQGIIPFEGDSFYVGNKVILENFNNKIKVMEGDYAEGEVPVPYFDRIEINSERNLTYHYKIRKNEDLNVSSIDCLYKKLSSRIFQSDFCSEDKLGQLTFYLKNRTITLYSHVILTSSEGGTFDYSFVDTEQYSTEDMEKVIKDYLKEMPQLQLGEKIYIGHMERNYKKW